MGFDRHLQQRMTHSPVRSDRVPALAVIIASVAVTLAVLAALDRPWGCGCGLLWAMPGRPELNSQVPLDPYTALHAVFGAGLAILLARLRPDWSAWTLIAVVVAGSTVWEVVENLPSSIEMFGYDSDAPLAYRGDSILNALSDTAAATLGALLARRMSGAQVLVAGLAVELTLSVLIRDGFAIATWCALRHIV